MNNSSTSTDRTPKPHDPEHATADAPDTPASTAPAPSAARSESAEPDGAAAPPVEAPTDGSAGDAHATPPQPPATASAAPPDGASEPATADPPAAPAAAPPADTPPEAAEAQASHEAAPPASPQPERPAGVLASAPPVRTGTIAAVRGHDVVVEFTGKRAGVCPISSFAKTPRIGQRIGFVVERDQEADPKGPIRILRPAVGAAATSRTPLKELNVGDVHDVTVVGMNTGGLEVKVAGHRAFLPASQVDRQRVDNFIPYLNRTLRCRIVDLNRRKRRIVVSRRSVLEDDDRAELGKKMGHIKVGEVRECTVRNIEKFGVFLEWEPGIDGLVRLADLSHVHVEDPKSVVKVGDKVKAKVLRVEPDKARLTLGIRQATPSPWRTVEERYPVGADQTGTVTRTTDFGAFVELEPGIEGLIHISQLSTQRVEKVEHVVREGQQVTARVVQSDSRRKRIGLSIRAMTEPEAVPTAKASRDDLRKYVKKDDKQAHAGESLGSLMDKFGDSGGLKGGIG